MMSAYPRGAGDDERLSKVAGISGDPDLTRPNAARMYDYYLGGAANLAVDREAAERQLAMIPNTRAWARANRAFMGRAVRYMAAQGVDQFLDLGSGIPTVGNVHEHAQHANPDARVAYVDIEPVAVTHARLLLGDEPNVTVTQADIRRPDEVVNAPGVADLLDFGRPVAMLAVAILHFVPDSDDPVGIMAGYRDVCVPGSYLALSHLSRVTLTDAQFDHGYAVYKQTSTLATMRSRDEIAALLPGFAVVEPGVVLLDQWQPDRSVTDEEAAETNSYAAMGVLPATT